MSESITAHHFLAAQIIQEVKSHACVVLEYERLAALLELVLDNKEVMDILRKTPILEEEKREGVIGFESVYRTHILEGKKEFILMTPIHSFALSWLLHLYH